MTKAEQERCTGSQYESECESVAGAPPAPPAPPAGVGGAAAVAIDERPSIFV